jgi:lysophospholipase L1-like esterase
MFPLRISALLLWAVHANPTNQRRDLRIFEWTALGDSYASGVGSTTYLDGRRCLRSDQAYPMQLNGSQDLDSGNHIIHDTFCSGSSTASIKQWQLLDNDTSGQPDWTFGTILDLFLHVFTNMLSRKAACIW